MINIKNDFLLPFYENYKTNKIIDQKIQELCSKEAKTIDLSKLACAGDLSKVSLKIIKTIYEKNLERKKKRFVKFRQLQLESTITVGI